ncbi:MAG TPA: DUF1439 domain-containing protein [Polyangiaceae bacterium]|jgi:hypothetical protein|nr:DUF1439 domain-containing protein [Polyangiaceae bacterium]
MFLANIPRRALAPLLLLVAVGCKRSVTVEVEQSEIQQRLAAKFPVQKPVLLGTISLENPNVILRENSDRIGVALDAKLTLPLFPPYIGKLTVSGKPAYRPAEKAFYLQEAALESFEVSGLPAAQAEALRGPTEIVARSVLDSFPVYQFDQRNWKEVSAEHVLQSVKVENGKLHATLGL